MRCVYRTDAKGNVTRIVSSEKIPLRGTPPNMTMQETIMDGYRQLENSGNWPRGASKRAIKEVHTRALAEERK